MDPPQRRHCDCAGDGAPARAREEVRRFLDDALLTGCLVPDAVQDEVLLVATELVTNAVRHTPGPCALEVSWAEDGIDIDVTDPSPTPPRLRPTDPTGSPGGYGWPLVRRLASEIDVQPTGDGGKTIHVHLPAAAR
ncbi:ATP-binding protein [Streptomyces sp. NPDC032472]|uniref:ATP-binding protein n=1 Tax=Streptomyces sp. NPDC032472 TaxID=3155018 RepID=UPI0033D34C82